MSSFTIGFAEADCRDTNRAWAGGPSQPVALAALRLKPEETQKRPKRAALFSHVPTSHVSTQIKGGYSQIKDGETDGDLLRGNYDRTTKSRPMPGSLRLGISADASIGQPQFRNYEPRYTSKYENVDTIMHPMGAQAVNSDATNGYHLYWQPQIYRRQDTVIQEIDPQVHLANLAKNPLAGPLPFIQHTNVQFQTGCDTIGECGARSKQFC